MHAPVARMHLRTIPAVRSDWCCSPDPGSRTEPCRLRACAQARVYTCNCARACVCLRARKLRANETKSRRFGKGCRHAHKGGTVSQLPPLPLRSCFGRPTPCGLPLFSWCNPPLFIRSSDGAPPLVHPLFSWWSTPPLFSLMIWGLGLLTACNSICTSSELPHVIHVSPRPPPPTDAPPLQPTARPAGARAEQTTINDAMLAEGRCLNRQQWSRNSLQKRVPDLATLTGLLLAGGRAGPDSAQDACVAPSPPPHPDRSRGPGSLAGVCAPPSLPLL